MKITRERKDRIREVALRRQTDLTVILENVHDPHNIGAVIRSCDAVGIREIYVLYTEPQLTQDRLAAGKRTSGGARKWVDIHYFRDVRDCMATVKSRYGRILAAMPGERSSDLWSLDLVHPVALLLGNERDGLSADAQSLCDGAYVIPMAGMAQSLNISVACAVTLYEAFRQRESAGCYSPVEDPAHRDLLADYLDRHAGSRGKRGSPSAASE